ncbi:MULTISPECIES: hypothetical protein [Streptomyces]|uniref:hypothetical protein n=1 Tax=Streptomyces TaxID=1883 RepID=UPI002E369A9B|nr:hypothetical protein [Streptomyces sp. NBC_01478]WSX55498.1 hypothetical protein OG504_03250 [Streptomyces sp. NBC_00986]
MDDLDAGSMEFQRPEVLADAVVLYSAGPGRSVAAVARDPGVNHEMPRLWIKAAEESETLSVRAQAGRKQ